MTGLFVCVFCVSLFVSLLSTPIVRGMSRRVGLLDRPGGRKIHHLITPTGGGIVLFFAFIIPLWITISGLNLVINEPQRVLVGLILGGGFIVTLGILDDLVNLRPLQKLFGQIYAAIILFWFGFRIDIVTNPLDPLGSNPLELGSWSVIFTVLWIVSLVNAINLIDGLDGLAAGVSLIVALTLVVIGWQQQEIQVMFLSLALAGAIAGFLWFNYHPASIFLGDSGSMFLGFSLAAISLMGSRKSTTAIALLFPLVVGLMVPIADTATAILRRWWGGMPLFTGDRKHLHHRLLDLGIPHKTVVKAFYFLTLYLCIHALTFVVIPVRYALIVIALLSLGLFLAFKVLFFLEERLLTARTTDSIGPYTTSPAGPVADGRSGQEPTVRSWRWDRAIEHWTERTCGSLATHRIVFYALLLIVMGVFVLSRTLDVNRPVAVSLSSEKPIELSLKRGTIDGEWAAGEVIAPALPRYAGGSLDPGAIRIFSSDGKPQPVSAFRGNESVSDRLWLPLPKNNDGQPLQFHLFHSPWFRLLARRDFRHYAPIPAMGTGGMNILLWKRENISRDGAVMPVVGDSMTRVTVQLKPVAGDHFTNDIIDFVQLGALPLFEDSWLEYWLRIGDDFPRRPSKPDVRCSLQAIIDGEPTDSTLGNDHRGRSARWNTDLTDVAVDDWYHRRIPLGQFSGQTLSRLYIMLNDYPSIQADHPSFRDGRGGYFRFFIDAVSITRHQDTSTPAL